MKQAVLLHTIEDAEHYLANDIKLFKGAQLVSANMHVVSFLQLRYECDCVDLCSYVNSQEIQQIQDTAIRQNSILLNELDARLAPEINRYVDLSIRYFEPLYSFTGARQLVLFVLLELMLRRMLEQEQFDRLVTYEGKLGPLSSSFNEFLTELFPDVRVVTIRRGLLERMVKTTIHGVAWEKIPELLVTAGKTSIGPIQYIRQTGTNGRHILVFEPFNKIETLDQQAKAATIHTFQSQPRELKAVFDYRLNPKVLPEWDDLDAHSADAAGQHRLKLLYQVIRQHFCCHFIQDFQVLALYRQLHAQASLEQVYWQMPPVAESGALLLEYLLHDAKVQVTGIQTKATALLGKIAAPYAPATVFSRCHQFITHDRMLESTLKAFQEEHCKLPVFILKDQLKPKQRTTKREPIGIAVYLSPSMSFLETGQIPLHVYTQRELLKFLETLTDKNIHVITHPYATLKNCAVLTKLKEIQHVKWMREFSHEDYLTEHAPKLLLLDTVNFMVDELSEEMCNLVVFHEGVKLLSEQQDEIIYVNSLDEFKKIISRITD
ncbi:MAG: hypothetical protein E6X17_01115 [Sporomusaceae bacterium]|nr:hypothetical protein [Sporomusaceae bacterium]